MKQLIILFILFLDLNTHSQNYENKYKADICACIKSKKNSLQLANKIYNACFAKHMTTYAAFIDSKIKELYASTMFLWNHKIDKGLYWNGGINFFLWRKCRGTPDAFA